VRGLAQLPQADVQAMAHYLVALQGSAARSAPAAVPLDITALSATTLSAGAAALVDRAAALAEAPGSAQRMFESACGACHHDGDGPTLLGLNQPLALNTTLHSDRPDNLLRTVLDGIQQPAFIEIGHMPAFRHALDDRQIVDLAAWMRRRFAPDRPPWVDLPATVARLRGLPP
jgi:nicotinate dehydrogenase subunit B